MPFRMILLSLTLPKIFLLYLIIFFYIISENKYIQIYKFTFKKKETTLQTKKKKQHFNFTLLLGSQGIKYKFI